MTDPLREASSVAIITVRESLDPAQTPPRAALTDIALDVGAEPPEAAAISRIPRADRPPVVLEIPSSRLSLAGARIHLVNGSGLQHEAIREQGPALLLFHAVLESVHLPLVYGASNGTPV